MKSKVLIWPLVLLLGACKEKSVAQADAGKQEKTKHTNAATPAADHQEEEAADKGGKSTARPDRAKKPAMGSVAPGQPGKAISPYSNQPVDVKGLAAGSLVQDPKFPDDESKKFVVPEGVEDEEKVEPPVAAAVAGKPGLVYSPYNNKIIDVTGMRAGGVVADPTYPASEKKHFRIPAEAVKDSGENGPLVIPGEGGPATEKK